ncbi:MAG: hypothetical protein J3R72DRAFT_440787 [Linnemannia gamsii]|nr:MAG: hypothetical protein J3R72DRAFT_440787 [Linnemannia gamsii]
MNQLAESTRATINSLKAHALLSKALANDSKPTPGYLFPEIARLTQSSGTCTAVLSQLLKVITPIGYSTSTSTASSTFIGQSNSTIPGTGTGIAPGQSSSSSAYTSSPHVILKALKILRQLAQSGSVEFRIQLARQGKGPLSEVVGYRGSWDEIHGDRLNEDIRTIAEDLIEYMHSNPVQDHEILEARQKMTAREAAVMQNSTQGLPGYGNPEYEDSDSDEDLRRSKSVLQEVASTTTTATKAKPKKKAEKKREDTVSPPLPGFGNPEFEQQKPQSEPTLMGKLFDRLQDLTAPPPPMAMRAAYRQQEQRRQKLFVGEYSMHHPGHHQHHTSNSRNPKDNGGGIVMMGTNPFRRTQRAQGVAGGKWAHGATVGTGIGQEAYATNRTFSVPRVDHTQFRNTTSAMVYSLAQHVQTGYIRTQQQVSSSLSTAKNSGHRLAVWGVAGEVCAVVIEGVRQETLISVEEPQFDNIGGSSKEGAGSVSAHPTIVPVITGILRDMVDWIEQETWERRLRYLFVLDALLAHEATHLNVMSCSALPVLVLTLTGPHCHNAPQGAVQALSRHVSSSFCFSICQVVLQHLKPALCMPFFPSSLKCR